MDRLSEINRSTRTLGKEVDELANAGPTIEGNSIYSKTGELTPTPANNLPTKSEFSVHISTAESQLTPM